MTQTEIRQEIRRCMDHPGGASGCMRDDEQLRGRTLVPLGAVKPFPVPRWDWLDAVISMDATHAYIVMVLAARRRRGAFRRLIAAIEAAGLIPVVCAPIGDAMPAILAKWGWVRVPDTDDYWIDPNSPTLKGDA